MEQSLQRDGKHNQFALVDEDSLSQLLDGTIPGIVQTLVYNLRRITRKTFRAERDTLEVTYARFIRDVDTQTRATLLTAIVSSIKVTDLCPEVLLPFIENDPSPDLVTEAVQNYLVYGNAPLNEPLAPLRDILPMLSDPRIRHKGLILAGLMTFGDRRICAALRPYHSNFSVETCKQMSAAVRAKALHRCTLDYLMTWMLDLTTTADSSEISADCIQHLCRTLTSLVMQTSGQSVVDRSFNFGSYCFQTYSDSVTTDYQSVIANLEPLMASLAKTEALSESLCENKNIEKLIGVLRNPTDAKKQRQESSPRRIHGDRRDRRNDRRVVSIAPSIERRQENRRTIERRQAARR